MFAQFYHISFSTASSAPFAYLINDVYMIMLLIWYIFINILSLYIERAAVDVLSCDGEAGWWDIHGNLGMIKHTTFN